MTEPRAFDPAEFQAACERIADTIAETATAIADFLAEFTAAIERDDDYDRLYGGEG